MLTNYLKIAFRSLRKHKGYLFINVFGLALGIACCLLIFLFVEDELSFDRFHTDADRLYRVGVQEDYNEGRVYLSTVSPIPLARALEDNFPEVEATVRVATFRNLVRQDESTFSERIHLVDPNFFEVFDFPLIQGDPSTVFKQLNVVVLSEQTAERYFGDANPVGRTLSIMVDDAFEGFLVTGVAEEAPTNSSIQFDFLLPYENGNKRWSEGLRTSFMNVIGETYIRLPEGYDPADLEAKAPVLARRILGDRYQPGMYELIVQPITDIHLNPDLPAGIEPTSDPRYATLLSIIALLVLLIACINFTTLSLGRSAGRAREVGMRKALGAFRGQLMRQFWGEALMMTVFALFVGLVLAEAFLPTFNTLSEKELALTFDGSMILWIITLVVIVAFVAGSYPAVFLSRFNPVDVLKGRLQIGDAGTFRRVLTGVQFGLSIFLIVCTLTIAGQLRFLQEKNLGFDRELVVNLPTGLSRSDGMELSERFRNEVAGYDAVAGTGTSLFAFGEGLIEVGYIDQEGTYRLFNLNAVDPEYIPTMGMEMVAGRNFSRDIGADARQAIIVNEALVAEYGWDNPLEARLPGPDFPPHQIIGVVKDYNYESLHTPVAPLVLAIDPNLVLEGAGDVGFSGASQPKIVVRIEPGDVAGTLAFLEETWAEVAPGNEFSYTFVDDVLNQQYQQEARLGRIVRYATAFALLIACLGLFGLAALIVLKRTKEVGIRKVLGATVTNIVLLLTKDLAKLVLLAAVVAAPLAYFAMRNWLNDFAYSIGLGPGVFLLTGGLTLAVALLTVSYQSIRAARANPVKSLRYE